MRLSCRSSLEKELSSLDLLSGRSEERPGRPPVRRPHPAEAAVRSWLAPARFVISALVACASPAAVGSGGTNIIERQQYQGGVSLCSHLHPSPLPACAALCSLGIPRLPLMAPLRAGPAFVSGLPWAAERGSRHLGHCGGGGGSVLAPLSAPPGLSRVPRLRGRTSRPMRRPGGSSSGGGSCGRVVVAGPSFYSSSGMPSGSSSGMPLGSSLDDCKPAWSTVNGSGPFGAAEDDALTAVSPNVVTFMNNTHRQDLALYALNYGDKLVRLTHPLKLWQV